MEHGYTKEEYKMIEETRKILHHPNLPITATAVRVPVANCHGESINLELEKAQPIKTFSFSVHNEYEPTVIGKGKYHTQSLVLLPNFVGKNVSVAKEFASKNGINLVVNEVEGNSSQFIGQIINQNIPEKTDISMLDKTKTVTVTVVSSLPQNNPNPPEENENPEEPEIPGVPNEDNDTESSNENIEN